MTAAAAAAAQVLHMTKNKTYMFVKARHQMADHMMSVLFLVRLYHFIRSAGIVSLGISNQVLVLLTSYKAVHRCI